MHKYTVSMERYEFETISDAYWWCIDHYQGITEWDVYYGSVKAANFSFDEKSNFVEFMLVWY